FDEQRERLIRISSTSDGEPENGRDLTGLTGGKEGKSADLTKLSRPFDPTSAKEQWGRELMEKSSAQFRTGGKPICVPLVAGEHWLGAIVLADRVRGLRYSAE